MKHTKFKVAIMFATIFLFFSALMLIALGGLLNAKAIPVMAHFWPLPMVGATLITFGIITNESDDMNHSNWGRIFVGTMVLFLLTLSLTSCGDRRSYAGGETRDSNVNLYKRAKCTLDGKVVIVQFDSVNASHYMIGDTIKVSPSKHGNGRYLLYFDENAVASGSASAVIIN